MYHRGRWGTICDDDFGIRESTVVCRMLNYSSGVKVVKNAYRHYGRVNSSYPIWMDNVKCRGDEQSIAACRHNGWNIHDCDHFKGVGVVCSNGSSPSKEGTMLLKFYKSMISLFIVKLKQCTATDVFCRPGNENPLTLLQRLS